MFRAFKMSLYFVMAVLFYFTSKRLSSKNFLTYYIIKSILSNIFKNYECK